MEPQKENVSLLLICKAGPIGRVVAGGQDSFFLDFDLVNFFLLHREAASRCIVYFRVRRDRKKFLMSYGRVLVLSVYLVPSPPPFNLHRE